MRCVGHTFLAYAPHPCEVTAKIAFCQGNGTRKCVRLRDNFASASAWRFNGQGGNSNYLPSQRVELGESCLDLFTNYDSTSAWGVSAWGVSAWGSRLRRDALHDLTPPRRHAATPSRTVLRTGALILRSHLSRRRRDPHALSPAKSKAANSNFLLAQHVGPAAQILNIFTHSHY